MAWLFGMPFDHLSNTNASAAFTGGGSFNIVAGIGRNGVAGMRAPNGGAYCSQLLPTQPQTAFAQIAMKPTASALTSPSNQTSFLHFYDLGAPQVAFHYLTTGIIVVTRGFTAELARTAVGALPLSPAYPHIAAKVKIDPTAGTVELRINNVPVEWFVGGVSQGTALTGLNTRASANSYTTQVLWGALNTGGGNNLFDFCDVGVWDTSGSGATSWLGDKKVRYNQMTGAGARSEATIGGTSPAATTYGGVNELSADDDVRVNLYDATSLPKANLYTWPGIGATASGVVAIGVFTRARKDDAGTNTVRTLLRSPAGTEQESPDVTLTTNYVDYVPKWWETNPDTSAAWQPGDAPQIGLRRTA